MIDQAIVDRFLPFDQTVRQHAAEYERAGRLPDELAQSIAKDKLLKLLVPKDYGGLETHPSTFVELLFTAARADAAVGWFMMIGNTTGSLAGTLPEEWARSMYENDAQSITVGVAAPYGKGVREGDGLRVSGHWPFGSGAHNARYVLGGTKIAATDDQPEQIVAAFFDKADVKLHDNWQVSGLCGTGSNDFEVQDAYVPAGRWATIGGHPRFDRPLYRFPTLGLLALGTCAVSLGIAQRAIDEFLALANEKVPTGSVRALANRAGAQQEIARAVAGVGAARAYVHTCVEAAWQRASGGNRMSIEDKAGLRLAAANATWAATDAVDRLYHAAGTTSIYNKNALQKCFRDVHVTTQHGMVNQTMFEVTGKVLLGIDPKTQL